MQVDLTFKEAKKIIQQKEAVRDHTQQLYTTDHKCVEEQKPQKSKNAHSQHNR